MLKPPFTLYSHQQALIGIALSAVAAMWGFALILLSMEAHGILRLPGVVLGLATLGAAVWLLTRYQAVRFSVTADRVTVNNALSQTVVARELVDQVCIVRGLGGGFYLGLGVLGRAKPLVVRAVHPAGDLLRRPRHSFDEFHAKVSEIALAVTGSGTVRERIVFDPLGLRFIASLVTAAFGIGVAVLVSDRWPQFAIYSHPVAIALLGQVLASVYRVESSG